MRNPLLLVGLLAIATCGCTATKNIDQIDIAESIDTICVSHNPAVHMSGFEKELREQIEAKGIKTRSLQASFGDECEYELHYTANWAWNMSMPMHVIYINMAVTQKNQPIGQAEYNAGTAVTGVEKLGSTASKIRPLVDSLFSRQMLKRNNSKAKD